MIIVYQLYLLIAKLFLAGKDATSYKLKDKTANGELTNNRIKRWHRDGVILDILITLPVACLSASWWFVLISSILLRLSFFDLAFNYWAALNAHYLGSTAGFDKFFVRIFGVNGALKKSLFFFIILIISNIILFKFI